MTVLVTERDRRKKSYPKNRHNASAACSGRSRCNERFARGYLCCGISRQKIARCLGEGIKLRSVTSDLQRLQKLGVIEVHHSGNRQFFVLGHWERNDGRYVEHYYLEKLGGVQIRNER